MVRFAGGEPGKEATYPVQLYCILYCIQYTIKGRIAISLLIR